MHLCLAHALVTALSLSTPIGDRFGDQLVSLGDLNGDGANELLISETTGYPESSHGLGTVWVLDGASGAVRQVTRGKSLADRYGSQVGGGYDADGDRVPDYVVAAQKGPLVEHAFWRLISGKSGRVLREQDIVDDESPVWLVCLTPDANWDGLADVAIASRLYNGGSRVVLRAGKSGRKIRSTRIGRGLAAAIAPSPASEVGSGGNATLMMTCGQTNYTPDRLWWPDNVLHVFDLNTLDHHALPTEVTADTCMGIATIGGFDLDGDEVADWIVTSASLESSVRTVVAISGKNPHVLWSASGEKDPYWGRTLCWLHDIDGDGVREVVVGAPGTSEGPQAISVLSGRTGKLLIKIPPDEDARAEGRNFYGSSMCDAGDVDGDGTPELAVASLTMRDYLGEGIVRVMTIQGKVIREMRATTMEAPTASSPNRPR